MRLELITDIQYVHESSSINIQLSISLKWVFQYYFLSLVCHQVYAGVLHVQVAWFARELVWTVLFRTESIISAEERKNVWVGFSQFFLALLQEADSLVLNPTCKSSDWLSCPSNNEDSRLRITRVVWNVENLVSVQTSPLRGSLSHLSSSLPPSPPSCLFTVLPRPSLLFYLVSLSPRSPVLLNHLYPLLSVYQGNGRTCVKEKPGLKQCPGVSTHLRRKVFFLNCKMSKFFSGTSSFYWGYWWELLPCFHINKNTINLTGYVPLKMENKIHILLSCDMSETEHNCIRLQSQCGDFWNLLTPIRKDHLAGL